MASSVTSSFQTRSLPLSFSYYLMQFVFFCHSLIFYSWVIISFLLVLSFVMFSICGHTICAGSLVSSYCFYFPLSFVNLEFFEFCWILQSCPICPITRNLIAFVRGFLFVCILWNLAKTFWFAVQMGLLDLKVMICLMTHLSISHLWSNATLYGFVPLVTHFMLIYPSSISDNVEGNTTSDSFWYIVTDEAIPLCSMHSYKKILVDMMDEIKFLKIQIKLLDNEIIWYLGFCDQLLWFN